MQKARCVTILLLLAATIRAADFQTGQAARAVFGQPSFSAREAGVTPTSLALAGGKLYAADASNSLLTFDLSKLPSPKDEAPDRQGSCPVCGFSPVAQMYQPVLAGVSEVSVSGSSAAIVDEPNHRVLFWPNSASPQAASIVLGSNDLVDPVSVALDGKRLFVGDAALHRVLVWNSLPDADDRPPDAILGASSDTPGADTISRPAALVSDGANLYVGDSLDRRILVFTAADTPLARNAVLNSATLSTGPLAPGTLVSIDAAGLADASASAPDNGVDRLPAKLGGVQVIFDGVPLPLLSVSTSQVRTQLPYDTGNASAASFYVRTEHNDGSITVTSAAALRLVPASPGLYAFGGTEPRTGMALHAPAATAVHANDTDDATPTPVTANDPARPGELLTVWATGLGAVTDSNTEKPALTGVPYAGSDAQVLSRVTAIVNGRIAQVVSATLPKGGIGIYEVRILLPDDLPNDSKTHLLIAQDGIASNAVTIPVQNSIQ